MTSPEPAPPPLTPREAARMVARGKIVGRQGEWRPLNAEEVESIIARVRHDEGAQAETVAEWVRRTDPPGFARTVDELAQKQQELAARVRPESEGAPHAMPMVPMCGDCPTRSDCADLGCDRASECRLGFCQRNHRAARVQPAAAAPEPEAWMVVLNGKDRFYFDWKSEAQNFADASWRKDPKMSPLYAQPAAAPAEAQEREGLRAQIEALRIPVVLHDSAYFEGRMDGYNEALNDVLAALTPTAPAGGQTHAPDGVTWGTARLLLRADAGGGVVSTFFGVLLTLFALLVVRELCVEFYEAWRFERRWKKWVKDNTLDDSEPT